MNAEDDDEVPEDVDGNDSFIGSFKEDDASDGNGMKAEQTLHELDEQQQVMATQPETQQNEATGINDSDEDGVPGERIETD